MKPFDTKINRFGSWNLPQQQLSLSKSKSSDSLSLLLIEKRLKKEKNEVGYQNVLSLNSRD
jgi:hypothetical protein